VRWKHAIIWLLLWGGSPILPVQAADLADWRLVQLAPQEERAVFRAPDGGLKILKPGDRLGEQITLTGFDGGQVVLEKPGKWGRVTLFVGLVDGRQVIASRERQPLRKLEFTGEPAAVVNSTQATGGGPR